MTISRSVPVFTVTAKWQNTILVLLGVCGLFFLSTFFLGSVSSGVGASASLIDVSFDKFSAFLGSLFCVSLFMGLFPLRKEGEMSPSFLLYILGGLGIIISNNLFTFLIFWTFQRSLPCVRFVRSMKTESTSAGGTFLLQHLITFICLVSLLVLTVQSGYATTSFSNIPVTFFTWPVLILAFIVIFESHGIFPFHSWIHDMVGNLHWYQISSIFLSSAGVLLFVKLLLPTLHQDPEIFRIALLGLSIGSSIYWTVRGIFEPNVTKTTTYFYVAQASLILTGFQANLVAAHGAYLHMIVISLSGTALWSLMSFVQRSTSIKRLGQFYGLAQSYPKLATLFCLFGFSMIGIPLGASFVVEDLVITGLLETQPYLGLGHILATCLNGILFFLVFSKLFLGQASYPQKIKNLDMSFAQTIPYVLALLVMFLLGLYPSLFLVKLKW